MIPSPAPTSSTGALAPLTPLPATPTISGPGVSNTYMHSRQQSISSSSFPLTPATASTPGAAAASSPTVLSTPTPAAASGSDSGPLFTPPPGASSSQNNLSSVNRQLSRVELAALQLQRQYDLMLHSLQDSEKHLSSMTLHYVASLHQASKVSLSRFSAKKHHSVRSIQFQFQFRPSLKTADELRFLRAFERHKINKQKKQQPSVCLSFLCLACVCCLSRQVDLVFRWRVDRYAHVPDSQDVDRRSSDSRY